MAAICATFNGTLSFHCLPKIELRAEHKWRVNCAVKSQDNSNSGNSGRSSNRRVWRRRKLAKKDDMLDYRMERIPFLEEQVRKIKDTGNLLTMDIERLLLSEDNRFDFVNEVAAEAKQYVENNRDEYGGKKAILHVLSNRMNDAGFYRPDGYIEDDPFKPGPGYLSTCSAGGGFNLDQITVCAHCAVNSIRIWEILLIHGRRYLCHSSQKKNSSACPHCTDFPGGLWNRFEPMLMAVARA